MNLRGVIEGALIYDVLDHGNTQAVIDTVFAGIEKILKRDPRFPRLSSIERDLLFVDIRRDAEQALEDYIKLDCEQAADAIADAIAEAVRDERASKKAKDGES
jgi:hypothetical protein